MRAAWRVLVAEVLDPTKLVFVDECGTHTSLAPVYGYSPRGERLKLSVARKRGKNTTLLASITVEGMGPSMAVEGSTTKEVFEAYLEQVLLPELEEGQVLIMDKLPAHKRARVRELIEGRGCQLLYLPSYSPDYNPIEEAFSKVKQILRRACAGPAQGLRQDSRGPAGGAGRSIIRGQLLGCPGILRARRLPSCGSITMKYAVEASPGPGR
jgi:transposase